MTSRNVKVNANLFMRLLTQVLKTANGSSTVKAGGIGVNRTGDDDTCSTHSKSWWFW